jgi:hypothetical protein
MAVSFDEVGTQITGEELRWVDGVFFGFDVDCVLDRIGGYNYAVVCLGISADSIVSTIL